MLLMNQLLFAQATDEEIDNVINIFENEGVTHLNAPEVQELSSRSIGFESDMNVASTARMDTDRNSNPRVRSRSTTPPPPSRRRRSNNYSTFADSHNVVMQSIATSVGNLTRSMQTSYDSLLSSFQSAQAMLRRAEQENDVEAISFDRETMRCIPHEMASRVPRLDDDNDV